jgi:hypothetical protein
MVVPAFGALCPPAISVIRLAATANLAIVQIPLIRPDSPFPALDAKDRYRIGGGQITPRRSYLDQGGTTPLLRA